MTSDALRAVLLWSGVLDYGVLLWRNRSAEHQRVDIVFVRPDSPA